MPINRLQTAGVDVFVQLNVPVTLLFVIVSEPEVSRNIFIIIKGSGKASLLCALIDVH